VLESIDLNGSTAEQVKIVSEENFSNFFRSQKKMGENSQLRYFNDLFILCDEDKINKVTVVKASELFRSASLSNDAVKEVSLQNDFSLHKLLVNLGKMF
jgi:hypothetical protein